MGVLKWQGAYCQVDTLASSQCVVPALQPPLGGVCARGKQGAIILVLSGQPRLHLELLGCFVFVFLFPPFLSTVVQMSIFSHASAWASRFKDVCLHVQAHFCFPSVLRFLQKACSPWEPQWVLLGFF